MFLRQSIMRGGIPFTLTVPEKQDSSSELLEGETFVDALKRYKSINKIADFDMAKIEPFYQAVEALGFVKNTRLTLQEKAAKIRFNFKGRDYVLDYNFEEPGRVFILSRKDGKLYVKDCNIAEIAETLERF